MSIVYRETNTKHEQLVGQLNALTHENTDLKSRIQVLSDVNQKMAETNRQL